MYVARESNSGVERLFNRAVVLLDVIEPAAMETGRVTVDATVMASELAANDTDAGRARNRRVELVRR
jgi:flagellar motor protein MotB